MDTAISREKVFSCMARGSAECHTWKYFLERYGSIHSLLWWNLFIPSPPSDWFSSGLCLCKDPQHCRTFVFDLFVYSSSYASPEQQSETADICVPGILYNVTYAIGSKQKRFKRQQRSTVASIFDFKILISTDRVNTIFNDRSQKSFYTMQLR